MTDPLIPHQPSALEWLVALAAVGLCVALTVLVLTLVMRLAAVAPRTRRQRVRR